jgi:hypothetical protein
MAAAGQTKMNLRIKDDEGYPWKRVNDLQSKFNPA